MFLKGCNRGDVSYVERKRVPEGWGIKTEAVRKMIV